MSIAAGRRAPTGLARPALALGGVVLVFVVLSALFALTGGAEQPVSWRWAPSGETAGLLALMSLLRIAGRRVPAGLAALVVFALAAFATIAAAVPALLGRQLDLWWDLRHIESVIGLYRDSVGAMHAAAIAAALVVAMVLLCAGVSGAVALAGHLLHQRRIALPVIALALPVVVLAPHRGASELMHQAALSWRSAAALAGWDPGPQAALAVPPPPPSSLGLLRGHDLHLVFFESYGMALFEDETLRRKIAPSLERFAADAAESGFHLASHRLVAPTFGGGSWLAHATLLSGVHVGDELTYRLLLGTTRPNLPGLLRQAGWRSIAVMPGLKKPAPEAAFWRFERTWDMAALGYDGPPFGWFGIPDQYTLARVARDELRPGAEPLFAQWVLVSSHTPFVPVPPYVQDWDDAGRFASVPEAEWKRIYAAPDWDRLAGPYAESVAYDLTVLGAFLHRLSRDALVIVLGDHPPPAMVAGSRREWTVPIHLLARDERLLQPFLALGWRVGAAPDPAAPPRGMESFLADFLKAMDRPE